jgi:HK97 gp10 family phage protein
MSLSTSSTNSGKNWETVLLAEFNRRFAPAKTRDAMQEALDYGFAAMQSSTPVRTGNLKSSEGVSVTSDTEGEMHADAEYSGYVNGGTIHQDPQPFFDRGSASAYQRLKDNCSKL